MASVVELLADADTRLLTLTGPGGTGKTRLALQAASRGGRPFIDGITWVALAPLRDPMLVAPCDRAARSRCTERPGEPLVARSRRRSSASERSSLLDNAEHLLPDLARDVAS